jgi:hypothetical protein
MRVVLRTISGGLLVVVGIVFLVTPGPGIPLIYVGWRLVAGAAS